MEKPRAVIEAAQSLRIGGVIFGVVGCGLALWAANWLRALEVLGVVGLFWMVGQAMLKGYRVGRELLALFVVMGALWVLRSVRDPFSLIVAASLLLQFGWCAVNLYRRDCEEWFVERKAFSVVLPLVLGLAFGASVMLDAQQQMNAMDKRATATLKAAPAEACACDNGARCTGPRGGTYCITAGGSKRYF